MNDPTLRRPIGSRLRFWALAILLIIIYIWAFRGMQFEGLQGTAKSVSVAILDGFLHPDWSFVYIPEGRTCCVGCWIHWSFQCSEPSYPHLSVFRLPFGHRAI